MAQSDEAFERLVAQLQAEPPDDFVARRTAAVRDLRKQGERELAARIGNLRRPPLSVWAANRLHDVSARELEDLLAAGGRLREAQFAALEGKLGRGGAGEFGVLVSAHSAAVAAAVDAAIGFLAREGRDASDPVRRRLQGTLREASLGAPERQAALAEGRLTADLEPAGFGGFGDIAPVAPADRELTSSAPAEVEPPEPDRAAAARDARRAADEQRRIAREVGEEARALREEAERLAGEARAAAAAASEAESRATAEQEKAEALQRDAQAYEEADGR